MKTISNCLVAILLTCWCGVYSVQAAEKEWDPSAVEQQNKAGKYTVQIEAYTVDSVQRAARSFGVSWKSYVKDYFSTANGRLEPLPVQDPAKSVMPTGVVIYGPEVADPTKTYGVFVFVSSGDSDAISKYTKVFHNTNLIGVTLINGGNERDGCMRAAGGLLGLEMARRRYSIDPNRIYVSGISGGGSVCNYMGYGNLDLFSGMVPMVAPTTFSRVGGRALPSANLLKRLRLCIGTGETDFNKGVCEMYEKEMRGKVAAVKLIVHGGGHSILPSTEFKEAVAFLDAPLVAMAARSWKKNEKKIAKASSQGTSYAAMKTTIAPYLGLAEQAGEWEAKALAAWTELATRYTADHDKVKAAIEAADSKEKLSAADELLRQFKKDWRSADKNAEKVLSNLLRDKKKSLK